MNAQTDVIVIGGGQAGLASGYHLKKSGLRFLILEASNQDTGSWSQYYDSLKLFSPARFSSLPGMKIPGSKNSYPIRDEVVQYLNNYAKHFQLPIMNNQRVESIEKRDGGFLVHTSPGGTFQTKAIINASGSFHSPYIPFIEDQDLFQGEILHSSEYQTPHKFRDQRVLVVGRGNSAVQIAIELAEVSKTSLAVLKPVQFVKQKVWGFDLHYWLKVTGIDSFPFWRFGKTAPSPSTVIDLDQYKEKLAAGKPNQLAMFSAFYEDGIIGQDGKKEPVDTVIFATGFRPSLTYLRNSGALDSEGNPLQVAGISTSVPGLYYVGLNNQRSFASATLRGVGPDARYVVKKIIRYL